MKKCKCISHNQPEDWQTDKSIILTPPFPSRPVGEAEIPHKTVCVDYCIAKVIQFLWEKGIYTTGSCCGHNKVNPSVIVSGNKLLSIQVLVIEGIIKALDNRSWDIYEWRLTKINKK